MHFIFASTHLCDGSWCLLHNDAFNSASPSFIALQSQHNHDSNGNLIYYKYPRRRKCFATQLYSFRTSDEFSVSWIKSALRVLFEAPGWEFFRERFEGCWWFSFHKVDYASCWGFYYSNLKRLMTEMKMKLNSCNLCNRSSYCVLSSDFSSH